MARKRKAPQRRPLFVRQDEANQQLDAALAALPATSIIDCGRHENFLLGYVWSRVPARIRRDAIASLKRRYAS